MSQTVIAALTYNRPDLARRFVEQVGTRRTFLWNNGVPLLRGLGAARVHHSDRNYYWTGGWNRAIEWILDMAPRTTYVWMCNDDVEGASERMADHLAHVLDSDPNLAMVSPAIDGSPHPMMWPVGVSAGPVVIRAPEARSTTYIDGVCPMVRVSAWSDIGGFDEGFLAYGADIDWCVRARQADWNLAVVDSEVIVHEHPGKSAKIEEMDNGFADKLFEKYGRSWQELRDGAQ